MGWAPACPGACPIGGLGPRVHWGMSSKVGRAPLGRGVEAHGALTADLSQRVLTAEFYEGCKVSDVEAIKSMGLAVQDVSAVCPGLWGWSVWPESGVMACGLTPSPPWPVLGPDCREADQGFCRTDLLHGFHPL